MNLQNVHCRPTPHSTRESAHGPRWRWSRRCRSRGVCRRPQPGRWHGPTHRRADRVHSDRPRTTATRDGRVHHSRRRDVAYGRGPDGAALYRRLPPAVSLYRPGGQRSVRRRRRGGTPRRRPVVARPGTRRHSSSRRRRPNSTFVASRGSATGRVSPFPSLPKPRRPPLPRTARTARFGGVGTRRRDRYRVLTRARPARTGRRRHRRRRRRSSRATSSDSTPTKPGSR